MAVYLGSPRVKYFKVDVCEPLSGGLLYTYEVGTTTKKRAYHDITDAENDTNPLTNPIVLDSRGEAMVILNGNTKLVLKDKEGSTIWTVAEVGDTGASDNAALKYTLITDAVNKITITNAETGLAPSIVSSGTDTNVGLSITSKGSGKLFLDGGATGSVQLGESSSGTCRLRRAVVCDSTLTVSGAGVFSSTVSSLGHTVTGTCSVSGTTTAANLTSSGAIGFLPAGTISFYGNATAPTGWLPCNGAAVSRTTYASLFANIGTAYGSGDGSTTFNVPTSARNTLVGSGGSGTGTLGNTVGSTGGSETHTLTLGEMGSHTHTWSQTTTFTGTYTTGTGSRITGSTAGVTGSAGGGGSHNNMQPSLVMLMIIKAF
jgi:microcystin-dependent protein